MVGVMTFPGRLKIVIDKSGLKREEFAARVSVSKRQLFNYLGGSSEPTLSFFQRVKKEFPWVNLDWLTTGVSSDSSKELYNPTLEKIINKASVLVEKDQQDILKKVEDKIEVAEMKEVIKQLKPHVLGEVGVISINLLIQLLLPAEIILAALGLDWISGPTAITALLCVPIYWLLVLRVVKKHPAKAVRWLKHRYSSIITFNSPRLGEW